MVVCVYMWISMHLSCDELKMSKKQVPVVVFSHRFINILLLNVLIGI